MAGELGSGLGIDRRFVGHQGARAVFVGYDDLANGLGGHIGDMAWVSAAFALDQGDNGLLRRGLAVCAVLGLAADIDFVSLDHLVCAAESARRGMAVIVHCL